MPGKNDFLGSLKGHPNDAKNTAVTPLNLTFNNSLGILSETENLEEKDCAGRTWKPRSGVVFLRPCLTFHWILQGTGLKPLAQFYATGLTYIGYCPPLRNSSVIAAYIKACI